MKPLISVIVPVYNVEPYLKDCLDSILSQSYSNLEIILVDDGSTDGSGNICDDYNALHQNMVVIHTPNRGPSAARNMGLDMMRGEFVLFVDSDDILLPGAVQILFSLMKSNKANIAIGAAIRTLDSIDIGLKSEIYRYSAKEAIADSLYQKRLLNSPCAKLYNSRLFDTLRFTEEILYEDLDLIYRVFAIARCVAYTTSPVYYYRIREGSITMHFSAKRLDVLDVVDRIEQNIAEKFPLLLPAARDRVLSASFNMFWLMAVNDVNIPEAQERCWKNICRLRCGCLKDRNVRLKNKMGALLSYLGRNQFSFICKNIKKYPSNESDNIQ